MNIVVLDGYAENPGDLSWQGLEAMGALMVYDRTPPEAVAERIGSAEIVYTNKTPITAQTLAACTNLRFIGVLATGHNIVDSTEAARRGIPVANVPAYGTMAVAQFTIALLLEACHHVGHHARAVAAGRWSQCPDYCFWDTPQIELDGQTLGIIGLGRIGKATARIASALGMKALAYRGASDAVAEQVPLERLFADSDVISLHCPLTDQTQGIISQAAIEAMRPGVIVLNTARGALIDEVAMAEALNGGKVAAYACDVVSQEPIKPDNPLLTAKNCIITPHVAWAPRASRQRLMDVAVENLAAFLAGKPQNIVNHPVASGRGM